MGFLGASNEYGKFDPIQQIGKQNQTMGFMNYIETFFFFSLAVSFVLILLLVYHFKQRMVTLEQKSDTMVSIINDIAKELTYVRQISTNYMMTSVSTGNSAYSFPPPFHGHGNVCSDRVEVDDSEEDDDDEDDDEDSEDDDEDSEDEEEDEPRTHIIVVSDTEVEPEEIKVVCLEHDIQETCGIDEEPKFTDNINDIDIDIDVVSEAVVDPIDVSDELIVSDKVVPPVPDLDMYRKMSTQALKAAVLASGLSEDPSKMKKPELLQMLIGTQ
jgi:hypothetical protein